MRENLTSLPTGPTHDAVTRPKLVLAYSVDAKKAEIGVWLRAHGLHRSMLAMLTDKQPSRGVTVEAGALVFKAHNGGLDASLRRSGSQWALSAGAFDELLDTPDQAAGLFCAIVCGDARLKVETTRGAISRMALEMCGANGEWTEMLVTGVPRLSFGCQRQTTILANGRIGIAR
jgi:hypothetical protein